MSYFDADKRLKFLTNNFTLPALTIVVDQEHLRIKSFYGTSENQDADLDPVSIYVLIVSRKTDFQPGGRQAEACQNSVPI